ncbi:MAG: hypothetical protein OXI33_12155 [Chloroflexota bacterium]|nr:hypothetical protein [Chloroflexota bacterium]
MGIKFDTYSYRARVLPVYLTLAPVVLLLAAVVPEGLKLPIGGAAALVFAPISFFLGQVGADFGKRLEKSLWTNWGGPPTTRFLRQGNREFNEVTRDRVHAKLRQLGLHVPTREEQEHDQTAADTHYQSCTEDLIRRTRDAKKFPLVFKGLTEYGFRRNLLGLKGFGVFLNLVGVAGSAWATYTAWNATTEPPAVSLVAGLISAGLLLAWLVWVTDRTVKLSADRYARFLLEAALEQE